MLNIAIKRSLVRLTLIGGEKVYKECSREQAIQWKMEKRDFTLLDGSLIASSLIFRVEKASDLEVFEIFIRPTLSISCRDDFDQIASKARALSLSPSSKVIVERMEEMKRDKEAHLTISREIDNSEGFQRKKQAEDAISQWKSWKSLQV